MKLTKELSSYQELKLRDLIYEEMPVEDIRKLAAEFLIEEGFEEEDVKAKIVDISDDKEVSKPMLRATSVWCIMFPWFCK